MGHYTHYTGSVKATGACPQWGGLQFVIPLFSHYSNNTMMSRVENFLNRSYARFASTTTTITAYNVAV